jgi:hypothetical protein
MQDNRLSTQKSVQSYRVKKNTNASNRVIANCRSTSSPSFTYHTISQIVTLLIKWTLVCHPVAFFKRKTACQGLETFERKLIKGK